MLYRYCGLILQFPAGAEWLIYRLDAANSVGLPLRQVDQNTVDPGNYMILDQSKCQYQKKVVYGVDLFIYC